MQRFYILIICFLSTINFQAQDFKFGKVSKEEVKEEFHSKFKDANAAILFRSQSTYYEVNKNTGITLVTEVHERIKIYNKDGFDWADKEVQFYKNGTDKEKVTGIKGFTYNLENGKLKKEKLKGNGIFEEEVNDYYTKAKFTLPAVTEGSVIEYKYNIRSPFLVSIDRMPLQFSIPVNQLEASVRIPEFFNFKKYFNPKSRLIFDIKESRKNFTYNYTQSRRTGQRVVKSSFERNTVEYLQNIYELKEQNIPPLKKDVYVDYLQNYAAFLSWELQFTKFPDSPIENYSQTWEGVTSSIFDGGFERELNRTNFFKKEVDDLLAGINEPAAKIAILYDFVREKVKWNELIGYQTDLGTRTAFKDGVGNVADINLLLITMLRHAGINANPVLSSTKDNGIPIYPTRNGFNYVIAGVELPNEILLLDATDANSAIGELPHRARNWQGRIFRDHGSSTWVDLMPKRKSVNTEMLNLQFDGELNVQGKSVSNLNGLYAKKFRDNYMGLEENNYVQLLEEDKGNIVISNLDVQNEKQIGKDIRQSYDFELRDVLEEIGDKVYLKPMLFAGLEENPFKADERYYPIFFDFPAVEDKTINILVPEGFTVESLPESNIVDFKEGKAVYKFIATQNGKFLRIESVLDLNQTVFSSEDYAGLKKFYRQMVEKHSEAIVFAKS